MKNLLLALLPLFAINYGYSQTYIPNKGTATPSVGYSYNIDGNATIGGLTSFGTGAVSNMRTLIKGLGTTSATYPLVLQNGGGNTTFYSDDTGNARFQGNIGLGTAPVGVLGITIGRILTGGPSAGGILIAPTAQSDVTGAIMGLVRQSLQTRRL